MEDTLSTLFSLSEICLPHVSCEQAVPTVGYLCLCQVKQCVFRFVYVFIHLFSKCYFLAQHLDQIVDHVAFI